MAIEALDGLSGVIAGPMHADPSMWTDAFGPELLAWIPEIPGGLFLTDLGNIVLKVIVGFGALGAAILGTPSGRDKAALFHLGAHFLTHPNAPGLWGIANAAIPTPAALAAELTALREGIRLGDLTVIRSAFAFSPDDITNYFRNVSAQWQSLVAPTGAAAAALLTPATPEQVVAGLVSATSYGEFF